MEKLHSKLKRTKKGALADNRFAAFAYKPLPAPFGLGSAHAPIIEEILAVDASLGASVNGLMVQARAGGTMENYEWINKNFADFCSDKGYSYPDFSEKAALHFVIQLDKDTTSLATLCQVKPALSLVEKLSGKKVSAWTDLVDTFLVSAKRRAATAN
jgi:hypothetical protein